MSTWIATDPPGRLSDYAHAVLVLRQLKDALRAARAATNPAIAVEKLQDARWFCDQFSERVNVLGPEADDLDATLFLGFSSINHPSGNGFVEAITATGASREKAINSLLISVRNCLSAIRRAKNAVAFPQGSGAAPPSSL